MTAPDDDTLLTTTVDGIPVLCAVPSARSANGRAALWLPYFTGTTDSCRDQLRRLSADGFVALSLDPWRHGARATTSMDTLAAEVGGGFRRHMWPILGRTTLDASHVLDWAMATYELTGDVVAGGVSMGGDVAVALAGLDPRVSRVAAVVATPDWTRPGRPRLEPGVELDQGTPTPSGQWLYAHLDPMVNRAAFARAPHVLFVLGSADTVVPPAGALGFRAALAAEAPAAARAVTVEVHDGFGHLEVWVHDGVADRVLTWLASSDERPAS